MVLLDFASDDSSDSNPYLRAYDSSGTLLDSDSAGFVALGSFVTLQVSAPNIAYIEASWDDVNRIDNGILDNLRYESAVVPEPSTLAVAGVVGLIGAAYRWRRSKRPSADSRNGTPLWSPASASDQSGGVHFLLLEFPPIV